MSGGIKEYQGVFTVYFVSETAQVELRSGRVEAPARMAAGYKGGSEPTWAKCSGMKSQDDVQRVGPNQIFLSNFLLIMPIPIPEHSAHESLKCS